MTKKHVEVAAAVIMHEDGRFLLGQRPTGTAYAGYWEFPGGKIEQGETAHDALLRELREELGMTVKCAYPWITREFIYPHAHVRLHFFRVTDWQGLQTIQHDALTWQKINAVTVAPMLPANKPILQALALPHTLGITQAGIIGIELQLKRLEQALSQGLRLVQLREPLLSQDEREIFAKRALQLVKAYGGRLLINTSSECDHDLATRIGADGVHLTAAQLKQTKQRPKLPLVSASCHTPEELNHAAHLALDFVVLGPVNETPTHPGTSGIGWQAFSQLINGYPLPVFAIGGMTQGDLVQAWQAGAHGIAGIRGII